MVMKQHLKKKLHFQFDRISNLVNMNMPEGLKNITVQASKLLMTSSQVLFNVTAVSSKPITKGIVFHSESRIVSVNSSRTS